MRGVYLVRWKTVWKNLSKYMSMAIVVPLILFMGLRFISHGFDYNTTFEHLSIIQFIGLLAASCLFSVGFALLIALWMKLASVSIFDGWIFGRSYWGLKKRIPLSDIESMKLVNQGGFNLIAVSSENHGTIYISVHTERLDELIGIIESYSECEVLVKEHEG